MYSHYNRQIYVGIVKRYFSKICNLRTNGQNLTKYLIRIIIDVGIVNYCFSQSCNRDTTLNSRQDLVFIDRM